MKKDLDRLAILGLALGAVLGMAGTFVGSTELQQVLWAIDGAGLVMAASLLAVRFLRQGNDIVAAGFFVFAVAEGVLMSGTAAGPAGSVPAFAAGAALWATALLLVSVPRAFPTPVRAIGIVAALLFVVTSLRMFSGAQLLPTSSPLPFFAYPFLVLTFLGWIWTLVKEES